MNLKQTIKDQQEGNRDKFDKAMCEYLEYLGLKNTAFLNRPDVSTFPEFHSVAKPFADLLEQTAEAVLAAVVEMVAGKRKEEDPEISVKTLGIPRGKADDRLRDMRFGYNRALDDILSQLKANQES